MFVLNNCLQCKALNLYVNIQHSTVDDGDSTWAISRKG